MKICMFTNTYLPHVGGVARSVDFFAKDLRKLGHRVLVVAPTFPTDMGPVEDNDRVLRVPAVQNFNGSDFSVTIPAPFIVSQRIENFKPDILHSHHPFLMGDTALRIARRRDLPLVFTHHTLYERYTHYVPLDSKALQDFVINLSTRYANFCDRVVAPSSSIARLIRRRGVQRPIEEIPTGVDADFFAGAIEQFFQNLAMTDRWRRQALETACNLSRQICARRLESLYRSAIAARMARPEKYTGDELIPWDSLLEGIKVEWELLSEKTSAAVKALRARELPDSG